VKKLMDQKKQVVLLAIRIIIRLDKVIKQCASHVLNGETLVHHAPLKGAMIVDQVIGLSCQVEFALKVGGEYMNLYNYRRIMIRLSQISFPIHIFLFKFFF